MLANYLASVFETGSLDTKERIEQANNATRGAAPMLGILGGFFLTPLLTLWMPLWLAIPLGVFAGFVAGSRANHNALYSLVGVAKEAREDDGRETNWANYVINTLRYALLWSLLPICVFGMLPNFGVAIPSAMICLSVIGAVALFATIIGNLSLAYKTQSTNENMAENQ